MSSLVDELTAVVNRCRADLAKAEANLDHAQANSGLLSESEIKAAVLAMETRDTYKKGWAEAVHNELYENVKDILEECYGELLNPDNDELQTAKDVIGKKKTVTRQRFILKVIQYLHSKGSFLDDEDKNTFDTFDTFDDTAGGCNEVVWNAAVYIVKYPDWTVWPTS